MLKALTIIQKFRPEWDVHRIEYTGSNNYYFEVFGMITGHVDTFKGTVSALVEGKWESYYP